MVHESASPLLEQKQWTVVILDAPPVGLSQAEARIWDAGRSRQTDSSLWCEFVLKPTLAPMPVLQITIVNSG